MDKSKSSNLSTQLQNMSDMQQTIIINEYIKKSIV